MKLPENTVTFQVSGRYALFTDPLMKLGGEKLTLQIPPYEALRGVLRSIYDKPTFIWYVDKVRIMNTMRTEGKGVLLPSYYDNAGKDLSYYTYLKDVCYQVEAHFEWNKNRPEFSTDRNWQKHLAIARRAIDKGGYKDVFLGTRECQAYVEPCLFGEGEGAYDNLPQMSFPMMHHSFVFPEEAYSPETEGKLTEHMWEPVMRRGVIEFPRPEDCSVHRIVREAAPIVFVPRYGEKAKDWEVIQFDGNFT